MRMILITLAGVHLRNLGDVATGRPLTNWAAVNFDILLAISIVTMQNRQTGANVRFAHF